MARKYAQINVSIWQDADFRALPALAKQLYLDLWLHPTLSYAGVADWRPGRFAGLHPDLTTEDILTLARCLEARLFIIPDEETEEVLIRSWVRFDGLLKQPRLSVSYANAYAAVTSNEIRGVLVHEAKKLHKLEPDLAGWKATSVQDILDQPSLDPRSRDLPADPYAEGLPPASLPGKAPFGPNAAQRLASVSLPPTTSTTTPTYLHDVPAADATDDDEKKSTRRRPERPLPASWKPTARHHEFANEHRIDIAQQVIAFRNHAETHDRRARNWDAAFRTWLSKALEFAEQQPGGTSLWDEVQNGN